MAAVKPTLRNPANPYTGGSIDPHQGAASNDDPELNNFGPQSSETGDGRRSASSDAAQEQKHDGCCRHGAGLGGTIMAYELRDELAREHK
ncbi:hypothetical protein, partial [Mesorhizobium sp.]|uniref:hypothetical protein n=1 Tax=Mesorhizobium sp. TaxID=1871066 RepID=UPI0025D04CC1